MLRAAEVNNFVSIVSFRTDIGIIPTSFLKDTLTQFLFSYTSSKIIPVGLATPIIFSSPKRKIILVQLVSFRTDIGINHLFQL